MLVRTKSVWKILVLLCVLALVAAACGDDDDDGDGGGATATTAAEGGGEQATGEPIVIGMINQEDSPAGSFPEQSASAMAAAEYINNELGGVDGRPLQIDLCTTVGTPESSQTCANEMVEKGVVLVTSGTDFGTSASIPIMEQNDMLYVGGVPLLPPEYTSPNAFFFVGGSIAAFPGQARWLGEQEGVETVAIIYTDNEPGLAAATTFLEGPLNKLGVTDVSLIPEKADATDFTASVTAAVEGDPDAVMVLFAAAGCSNIMKAKEAIGASDDIMFVYPGSCSDDTVIDAGGAGADGAFFNMELLLFTEEDDPEVATYLEKLEQYGTGDVRVSMYSQATFSAIMNIKTIFEEVGVDNLSTDTIREFLLGAKDQPNFMAHPYSCDGTPAPGFAAVCNAHVRMVQYQDGDFTDLLGEWISGTDLVG
ncbi:MAG: ABC transporter substrate-binding protein [Acidimicrobiia bacterium]|nr:ABC transporter substrate-binding protein [Acidimicrobiia bacterium]